MPKRDSQRYERKRDFARTPEPAAPAVGRDPATRGRGPLTFVVQKHAARRLHYDLRLELDGALKSWAVPRGPSVDPKERRLAVAVEDHPLDYRTFEGVIPGGQYGAGEDIVWDNGTYSPDEAGRFSFSDRAEAEARVRAELAAGKLSFRLRGRKLKGSWALVRTDDADGRSWLLLKHRDAAASAPDDVLARDASVLTAVTIDQLKAGATLPPASGLLTPNPAEVAGAKPAALPASLRPMLATARAGSFSDPAWVYEPKLDGIRALARIEHGQVRLRSRNGMDLARGYPALAEALAAQPADAMLLDGEIVAPDAHGVPSFARLQRRMGLVEPAEIERAEAEIPVIYYVFDLLHLDGVDLRRVPLWQRRELLLRAVDPSARLQALEPIAADGRRVYRTLVDRGFEGVVAKRRDSRYLAGKRSTSWLKIKHQASNEFLVGGYTVGNGSRAKTFGALLLGQRDDEGALAFVDRVGSGFSAAALETIRARLDPLVTPGHPFTDDPPSDVETVFVRPELVAEARFTEWTPDRHLRAPVFLRLRDDKPAPEARIAERAPRPDAGESEVVAGVSAELSAAKGSATLRLGEARVEVSNLRKALWPAYGDRPPVLKRDYLRFLAEISPVLLPQLRDRPLTLTRYPNGIDGKSFYQKQWTQRRPDFVQTVAIYSEDAGADRTYLLCNNLPTLLWLGQLADLTLHVSLARVASEPDGKGIAARFGGSRAAGDAPLLNYPDFLLFDLDPFMDGEAASKNVWTAEGFARSASVALRLKRLLDGAELRSFVKTSGASGLHVFVPIVRNLRYDAVRAVCRTIAQALVRAHPKEATIEFNKQRRTGKVYIDVNQNGRGKSLAAAYSARAQPGAPVSMPLRWVEVERSCPWTTRCRASRRSRPRRRGLDAAPSTWPRA